MLREWDPHTKRKRIWHETIDHNGTVRRVRPEKADKVKRHFDFDENGQYTGIDNIGGRTWK